MRLLRALVALFVLVAVGCSALPIGSGGVDGPVIYSGPTGHGNDAEVRGTISLDGECLYFDRSPVVWPRGTRWQEDPPGVILPDGEVALIGQRVIGSGGYLKADHVESVAGSAASELATRCANAQNVAVFNSGSDVTIERLPIEDPQNAGMCEEVISDFAEGAPAASTSAEEAAERFQADSPALEGLTLGEGKILLREEQVGTYRIVRRPGDTFAVESGKWCFQGG